MTPLEISSLRGVRPILNVDQFAKLGIIYVRLARYQKPRLTVAAAFTTARPAVTDMVAV